MARRAFALFLISLPVFAGTLMAGEEDAEGPGKEIDTKKQETFDVAVIETRFGNIAFEFYPGDAPNHVKNFKKLAGEGFYNGTTFHRVVPAFIIQGGDPLSRDDDRSNDGTGRPDYTIDAEINSRKHFKGTVSMSRLQDDKNSAGSQFFICLARQPSLDDEYTIFGKVIEGMQVVSRIATVETDSLDNPIDPVLLDSVYIETREK